MKQKILISIFSVFFIAPVYANDIKQFSDWKLDETGNILMAVTDGARAISTTNEKSSIDTTNLARLAVICQKKEKVITTMILPEKVTPAGKDGATIKYSYTIDSENKFTYDWKKIISKQNRKSIQTNSRNHPVEMVKSEKQLYLAFFRIEESDQPICFGFSLRGFAEAVEPLFKACELTNDNLSSNNDESQVFYATEINNNLIGQTITIEGAERYALFAKEAFLKRVGLQYKESGFSLNALPSVSHKIVLLEASGKTIANISFESTGDTIQGRKTTFFTHIIGFDHDKMHKVICSGIRNLADDKKCYAKVTEVFGKLF